MLKTILIMLLLIGVAPLSQADAPLMTKWAKEVHPGNVLPEYPRPQMARAKWQSLNGTWQWASFEDLSEAPFGRELEGRILVPFCVESPLSGVGKRVQKLWYRRTFTVPAEWKEQRILLHFEAVDYDATVWVNGKELGSHRGGYDAFSFDITDALVERGPQEVVVLVSDTTDDKQVRGKQHNNPHGIWYTPTTGIWQTVWLEPVVEHPIRSVELIPELDPARLKIRVQGGLGDRFHQVHIEARAEGKIFATESAGVDTWFWIGIPDARLWSPDDPFLYDLTVTLTRNGEVIDRVESYFGLRKTEVAPDEKGVPRILLNGEPIMQIGLLDQGYWPDGIYTAPTDEALRYDIEMTKQLGFNAIRKHMKIEPRRWYHWADRLGVLVWQDMPSMFAPDDSEAREQFEVELVRMIEQHGNSPSIIMWVVFNEAWGQYETERVTAMVKEKNPTRLVNNASGWTDAGVGDIIDVHKYPGPAIPEIERERAAVLGEFGGLGLFIKGHTWPGRAFSYRDLDSAEQLMDYYDRLLGRVWSMSDDGLCAAIYTQTTDVEIEANGLLTYDRILKVDGERIARANRGLTPRINLQPVVATSQKQPILWRYTFSKPSDGWHTPDFDDSSWQEGPGGFGTPETPGAVARTIWNSEHIWIRRTFTLDEEPTDDLWFLLHHDDDADIYINGVLAGKLSRWVGEYVEHPLSPEGRKALRKGENVIAVHCRQDGGGQYIDVGIVRIITTPASQP